MNRKEKAITRAYARQNELLDSFIYTVANAVKEIYQDPVW